MNNNKQITIAIIGGSGKAGHSLVDQALKRGYKVKVLARDPNKYSLFKDQLQVIEGDARNPDDVSRLLQGTSIIMSTLGNTKGEMPVCCTSTQNVLQAMVNQNISRYIVVTGNTILNTGDKRKPMEKFLAFLLKLLFPAIISDKQKELNLLQQYNNVNWTLFRLPFITQDIAISHVKVDLNSIPGAKITSVDLANFLLDQLADEKYYRQTPFIAN